jgi:hypothetical protein
MKVSVEIPDEQALETVLTFFASMHLQNITVSQRFVASETASNMTAEASPDPQELFGIWKDHPRTIDAIRTAAWSRGDSNR